MDGLVFFHPAGGLIDGGLVHDRLHLPNAARELEAYEDNNDEKNITFPNHDLNGRRPRTGDCGFDLHELCRTRSRGRTSRVSDHATGAGLWSGEATRRTG